MFIYKCCASRKLLVLLLTIFVTVFLLVNYSTWNTKTINFQSRFGQIKDVKSIIENFVKPRLFNSNKTLTPTPRKTAAVILVTQTRSGSSFVGEIFNRNPGVGYFYEPLYPFGTCPSHQVTGVSNYFSLILQHNFTAIQSQYKAAFSKSKVKQINGCVKHGMCFYGFDKCSQFMSRDLKFCANNKCKQKFDLNRLSKEIKQQKLLAFKVTRVCDFEDIKNVLTDPDHLVKIVHLVRDPRASINSLQFTAQINQEVFRERCLHFEKLVNYSSSRPDILNAGNYMIVRHEDISLRPVKWAEKIYQFIGVEMNNIVRNWLVSATSGTNSVKLGSSSRFGTTRNSKTVLTKWRQQLGFKDIQKVQNYCATSMKKLGYKKFDNSDEVANLNISSFILNEG